MRRKPWTDQTRKSRTQMRNELEHNKMFGEFLQFTRFSASGLTRAYFFRQKSMTENRVIEEI